MNETCFAGLIDVRRGFSAAVAISALIAGAPADAQTGSEMTTNARGAGELQEIVVTAQKREQSLQDVPVAITALNADTLQANRVQTVQDLSGLAPNLTVRQSAGSIGIPSFTMRGITSYGVVPGSDKEISIYLDGVYIGSPRGSIFDLPDISRVEVLRGPQGTLFGRNATAGAISITTRDPKGSFAIRQELSMGNYDYLRTRTTIDTPTFGPFSAYVTFMHNERQGDTRNLGAGMRWDRTASPTGRGVLTSPRTLGDKNAESWFAVLKFIPSDRFSMVYKFDRTSDHFTPEGVSVIGTNPSALPAAAAGLFAGALAGSPATLYNRAAKRPKYVNNSWSTPGFLRVFGHSLTASFEASDHLSFKNIAAYRKSFVTANSQLDGLGGLIYPFPPIAGARFVGTVTQNQAMDRQFSDELQATYNSNLMTLTVGGVYFWQKGRVGGPENMFNTVSFGIYPGGLIPAGNISESHVKATSLAAYAQGEIHVTPQLDIVAGGRVTRDHKTGDFHRTGPIVGGAYTADVRLPYEYKKTKPNYSLGVNYKIDSDILLYGKYSTAFVSGGSIGGVDFVPEEALSWEAGAKADLLGRRLRANLSLFSVKYKDIQTSQSGTNVGRPDLSTVIITLGDARAKGFEAELTALPINGLTLGGSLGYTSIKYSGLTPTILATYGGGYQPTLLPSWTSNLSAQYETQPLFDDARVTIRMDANWRSKMRTLTDGQVAQSPGYAVLKYSPETWLLNGRVALQNIQAGPINGEISLWGRNLTNNRAPTYPLNFGGFVLSSTFQAARTYGVDFSISF